MTVTFNFGINGETLQMAANGAYLLGRPTGMGPMEATHLTATSPFRDGARFLETRIGERIITAQFEIDAANFTAVQAARQLLMRKVNPRNGLGVLIWKADETLPEYNIDAVVEQAGSATQEDNGEFTEIWTVQFRCPFPYWRSESQTITTITIADGQSSNSGTITNNGDVNSYPTVTVEGANVSNPAWQNTTVGETLSFSNRTSPIALGETLAVDHFNMTAELDATTNWIDRLTNGSEFWPLEPGANSVTVSRTGTTGVKDFVFTHYDYFSGV